MHMPTRSRNHGFSLIELTIVLVIVALLSGGLMLSLASQRDQSLTKESQGQLDLVLEALLGFAMIQGRLPCPANPALPTDNAAAGMEALQAVATDSKCALEYGVIPWRTLALKETDAWGNRLTYFVGGEFANQLTDAEKNSGKRSRIALDTLGKATIQDGNGNSVALEIPAVIVSHGNRSAGAYQINGTRIAGADGSELENANDNTTFVSRIPNETFDDHVSWVIPSVLKSRLVTVGKLP